MHIVCVFVSALDKDTHNMYLVTLDKELACITDEAKGLHWHRLTDALDQTAQLLCKHLLG